MSSDINVQTFSGKVNITSNLLVGTSHLFVDTINNRVGLVTNTPDAGLHVNSNAYVHTDFRVGSGIVMNDTTGRITAGAFHGDGTNITGINSDSGSWVNGTDVVYLSTIGDKVGIGTTSPDKKLHIYTTASESNTQLFLESADRYATMQMKDNSGGVLVQNDQGDLRLITGYDASMANGSEAMRIKGSGNVGIGESSPAELLHIRGTGPHMLIEGASNENGKIDFSSGPSYRTSRHQIESRHYALSGNGYRNWLAFNVNEGGESTPSTRMVIRGDGRVGIGTDDPQAPFHVKPVNNSVDAENTLLDFRGDFTGSNHGYLGIFATETHTNAVGPDLRFKGAVYNGTGSPTINQVMCLKPSGNVGIGTNSPDYTLDVQGETGYDGSTTLRILNPASAYGRNQLHLVGRYEGNNDAFSATGARNAIMFKSQSGLDSAITNRWTIQSFPNGTNNDLGFMADTNNTPKVMFRGSNGNVGIGTTSPGEKLDVNGTIKASLLSMNGYTMSKPPRVVHIDDSRSGCPPTQAANTSIMEYSLSLARTAYVYVSVTTILNHTARADCRIFFGGSLQQNHLTAGDSTSWNPVNITAGGSIGAGTTIIKFSCTTANVVGCQADWGGMQILIFET